MPGSPLDPRAEGTNGVAQAGRHAGDGGRRRPLRCLRPILGQGPDLTAEEPDTGRSTFRTGKLRPRAHHCAARADAGVDRRSGTTFRPVAGGGSYGAFGTRDCRPAGAPRRLAGIADVNCADDSPRAFSHVDFHGDGAGAAAATTRGRSRIPEIHRRALEGRTGEGHHAADLQPRLRGRLARPARHRPDHAPARASQADGRLCGLPRIAAARRGRASQRGGMAQRVRRRGKALQGRALDHPGDLGNGNLLWHHEGQVGSRSARWRRSPTPSIATTTSATNCCSR